MAMTKEERSKQAKERARERKARDESMPRAYIGDGLAALIALTGANRIRINISKKALAEKTFFDEHGNFHCELWEGALGIEGLGIFIRALACRYNVMVDEANAVAAASGLKPLKTMPDTHIEEAQPIFT